MRKWLDKTTALVLCGTLVLVACGGDDDEAAPVEPEPEPVVELTPEIIGFVWHPSLQLLRRSSSPCWFPGGHPCRGRRRGHGGDIAGNGMDAAGLFARWRR